MRSCEAAGALQRRLSREESFSEALEGQPEYPHYRRRLSTRLARPRGPASGHDERIREGAGGRAVHEVKERGALHRAGPLPFAGASGSAASLVNGRLLFAMAAVIGKASSASSWRRVPDFGPGDRVRVHSRSSRAPVAVSRCPRVGHRPESAKELARPSTVRNNPLVSESSVCSPCTPKIEPNSKVAARGDMRRASSTYLRERGRQAVPEPRASLYRARETVQPGLLHEPMEATNGRGDDCAAETVPRARLPRQSETRRQGTLDAQAVAEGAGAERATTSPEVREAIRCRCTSV